MHPARIVAFALLLLATPVAQANALGIFLATLPPEQGQAPASDVCPTSSAGFDRDVLVAALALGTQAPGGALDALACSSAAAPTTNAPPSTMGPGDRIKKAVDTGLLDSYWAAQPHGTGKMSSTQDIQAARAMSQAIFAQTSPDKANLYDAMMAGGSP